MFTLRLIESRLKTNLQLRRDSESVCPFTPISQDRADMQAGISQLLASGEMWISLVLLLFKQEIVYLLAVQDDYRIRPYPREQYAGLPPSKSGQFWLCHNKGYANPSVLIRFSWMMRNVFNRKGKIMKKFSVFYSSRYHEKWIENWRFLKQKWP